MIPSPLLLIVTALVLLLALGELRPLVRPQAPRWRRWLLNGGSSLLASALAGVAWYWPNQQLGIFSNTFSWGSFALLVLLYDLLLWGWHRLMHEWSWLWRFHRFHHLDPELDATTGLRFHPMEFLLSGVWRWAFLALLQPTLAEWTLATSLVTLLALFHHSRIDLPAIWERRLAWILVTPRWHHSHHHPEREWHDGHYAVVLTLWDRLFRTAQQAPDLRLGLLGEPAEKGWRWRELLRAFQPRAAGRSTL